MIDDTDVCLVCGQELYLDTKGNYPLYYCSTRHDLFSNSLLGPSAYSHFCYFKNINNQIIKCSLKLNNRCLNLKKDDNSTEFFYFNFSDYSWILSKTLNRALTTKEILFYIKNQSLI